MFFLLDLPLLENSATGLLAVLPKTAGALEDIEWICPFLPIQDGVLSFFHLQALQVTRLLLRWTFQEQVIFKDIVNEMFLEKTEHKHCSN